MRVMATPRSLDIEITTECNLRCAYCSHFSSDGDVGSDLPKEEWFRFFEELESLGVMDITLSGGEPFLREDIKEIISKIVESRMRFSVLTNGTLITEDLAEFLKSTNRLNMIQVSLDGISPETNDAYRGKGSLTKAINGIITLQGCGIMPTVRVTIHNRNVDHLEQIATYLLEDLMLPSFSTNSASPFGLCKQNEATSLSTSQFSKAMKDLLELTRKYPGRIQAQAGPLASLANWNKMLDAVVEREPAFGNGGRLTGCGCFYTKLAVRANGAMVPCCLVDGMVLGYVNRDSVKKIWQNNSDLNGFRERIEIPLSDFAQCKKCIYRDYCTGNCPATANSRLTTLFSPSLDGCLKHFLESGGTLPALAED